MRTPRLSRRQPKIYTIFVKILSRLDEIDRMAMNTQSLSDSARIALSARIAHSLTICARDTYEVAKDNVLEPQVPRSYNELLHRVTDAVVSHVLGREGYSLETILEMIQEFGSRHNRVEEMNWFLNRALQQTELGAVRVNTETVLLGLLRGRPRYDISF